MVKVELWAGPHKKVPINFFEIFLSLIECLKRRANKQPNNLNFFLIPAVEEVVLARGVWKHRPNKLPKVSMCVCHCRVYQVHCKEAGL